ncbi:MAG: tetratricopeptide repeat protein [Rhodothermales bacterium]|nr:tetratricopeptide repeat protein [Rhodothermales bacterium]
MTGKRSHIIGIVACVLVLLHSLYLVLNGTASLLYVGNVLLHVPVGIVSLVVVVLAVRRLLKGKSWTIRSLILAVLVASVVTGLVVLVVGNTVRMRSTLLIHGVTGVSIVAIVLYALLQHSSLRQKSTVVATLFGGFALIGLSQLAVDRSTDVITNEILPPLTMADAAMGGANGPFFPSPVATADGDLIPSEYFVDSKSCGRSGCHVDAYDQWSKSAHRFSSFNNQWYRKSIEYMQEVAGTTAPQWCAGCHDHALLFAGKMDAPVSEFIDTEAAQAGLGCISCHAIKEVKNTGGNAAFVLEYPDLHDLATSENPVLLTLHDLTIHLDPEPHRRSFLKPFHIEQSAEFCSSCHKVHLDEPVNGYRWVRGFNTYDNWQASGVSHQGARSFYQPETPQTCVSCHMPATVSDDPGNDGGTIRGHEFVAANTALAVANDDPAHLAVTESFLQSNQLRVDIFAVSKPGQSDLFEPASSPVDDPTIQIATTFAAGEEQAENVGSGGATAQAIEVLAPLTDRSIVLEPATTVRLDVVVRTLGLGHFFPTGTVDAQEAWLEVKVTDARNRVIFWSGNTDADGNVDPSAHFYRSLMIDERGNPIDKRNAFASRSVVYVNLIPPGGADVGHFIFDVPEDVSEVTVEAKLNYRKFIKEHTIFAYAGEMDNGSGEFARGYDDRDWKAGSVTNVSGALQSVPDVPIVVMAADSLSLGVGDIDLPEASQDAYGRWTDYGIGLLRSGDLHGAAAAFDRAVDLNPENSNAWVNLARVYVEEGDIDAAQPLLARALELDESNTKAHYFLGVALKALAEYDQALEHLRLVADRFPTDRVVLNQIGRILFLKEQFGEAIDTFRKVLLIDAEDLMAHYNLMIAYRAAGDSESSTAHQLRYERYKADERAEARSRLYRLQDPNANNESQSVHFHRSSL